MERVASNCRMPVKMEKGLRHSFLGKRSYCRFWSRRNTTIKYIF
jgi:hypothetical protein